MNSDLSRGNTSLLNAAQCGQVGAAYSTIVTLASTGPSAMSGSACGLGTSPAGTALALETSAVNAVQDKAAVAAGKARRGGSKGRRRGRRPAGLPWRVRPFGYSFQ